MSVALTNTLLRLGRKLNLTLGERDILFVMCFRADDNGMLDLSRAQIAEQAGVSYRNSTDIFKRLRSAGYVNGLNVNVAALTNAFLTTQMGGMVHPENKDATSYEDATSQWDATSYSGGMVHPKKEDATSHTKTDIKTHSNARANDYITSGETPHTPAVATTGSDAEAVNIPAELGALCAAWPKRTWANHAIATAYRECLDEGVTHEELMACLAAAKLSKQWEEQNGRFIPQLVDWLNKRRFAPDLVTIRKSAALHKKMRQQQDDEDELNALIYGDFTDETL